MNLKDNFLRAKTAIKWIWITLVYDAITYLPDLETFWPEIFTIINKEKLGAVIIFVGIIVYLISVIKFIQWFRRAYYNIHQCFSDLNYEESTASSSWFIPFYNLVVPYQIMKELYVRNAKIHNLARPNMFYVNVWWALFALLPTTFFLLSCFNKVVHWPEQQLSDPFTFALSFLTAAVTVKVIKDLNKLETKPEL